jgi:Sec-independent protein translocase protein TatA
MRGMGSSVREFKAGIDEGEKPADKTTKSEDGKAP